MNALDTMAQAARRFRARLLEVPGCQPLELAKASPNGLLEWDNLLLSSPRFRRAHVESLRVAERFAVLHVCVFPHLNDQTAIFGFDMIAGPTRVTGIFLDLSPVLPGPPTPGLRDVCDTRHLADFAHPRDLPSWATIFSKDMVAVRPQNAGEIHRAIELAAQALDAMLLAPSQAADATEGQASYIDGQRNNQHTTRMLGSVIGPEAAQRFVDDVLFPKLPTQRDHGSSAGAPGNCISFK